jgi:hypothetical protein
MGTPECSRLAMRRTATPDTCPCRWAYNTVDQLLRRYDGAYAAYDPDWAVSMKRLYELFAEPYVHE